MKKIYILIKKYGVNGILIYVKLKLGLVNRLSIPQIPHIISLRKNTSDIPTFGQVFIQSEYDLLFSFYPKTIIDAGANIGLAAIFFANKYPEARIISIEPESTNYELLKKNVKHYQKISTLNKALSNIIERLNVEDIGLGNWGFVTSRNVNVTKDIENTLLHSIKTISIPEIKRQYSIDYIDIVKIDIEGYEKELFESNFEEWVPKTRCIIIKLHDRMKKGCSRSLFKCISKYDFSFETKGENLIFLNNSLETTHNNI